MDRTESPPSLEEDAAPGPATKPTEPKRTVSWAINSGSPERASWPDHLVGGRSPVFIPMPPPPSVIQQSDLPTPTRVSSYSEETTAGPYSAGAATPLEPKRSSTRGWGLGEWGRASSPAESTVNPILQAPSSFGRSAQPMNTRGF